MKEKVFIIAILVLFGLNLVDAYYTLYWLGLGIQEANPILSSFSYEPMHMMFVKMGLCCGALFLFWWGRKARLAKPGMVLAIAVYTFIVAYHLWFMVVVHTYGI